MDKTSKNVYVSEYSARSAIYCQNKQTEQLLAVMRVEKLVKWRQPFLLKKLNMLRDQYVSNSFFLTQFIKIWICISFSGAGNNGTLEHNSMQAVGMMDLGQGSTDPVELRRLNFQTPGKLKNLWFFQSKNLELGIFFKYLFKVWCPTPLFQSWT